MILTLESGTQAFNIHRLYPDKLVVTREGGWQFTFKREEILKADNEEVARVLAEASRPLEEVKKQDLATFPDLLTQLDQYRSRVEVFSHIYDWLIPEASQSLRLLNDARHSVEKTLSAVQRTNRILEAIRQSTREGSPVPTNWEEVYDTALKEIEKIPFEKIRQTETSRIQKEKELLGVELSKKNRMLLSRLEEAAEELKQGVAEGSLTRSRRATLLGQMWRIAKEVPETESRKMAVDLVENLEKQTEGIRDPVEETALPAEETQAATQVEIEAATPVGEMGPPSSSIVPATVEVTAHEQRQPKSPAASVDPSQPTSPGGGIDIRILGGAIAAVLLLLLYFLVRPKGRSASKPAKTSRRVFVPAQNTPAAEEPTPAVQAPEPKVAVAAAPSSVALPPEPIQAEAVLAPVVPEDSPTPPQDEGSPAVSLEEVLESAALTVGADTTDPVEESFHRKTDVDWEEPESTAESEEAEEVEPLIEDNETAPPGKLDEAPPEEVEVEEELIPVLGEDTEEGELLPEPEIEIQSLPFLIGVGEITPFDVLISDDVEMELGEGIVFENGRPEALFPLGESLGCVSKSGDQTEVRLVRRETSGDLAVCSTSLKHEPCTSMFYRAEALWLLHKDGISAYVPDGSELREVVEVEVPGIPSESVGNAEGGIPAGRSPLGGSDGTLIAVWSGQSVGGYRIRGESSEVRVELIWSHDQKVPEFSPPASNLAAISNRVCFVSQSGSLHLLDPVTGKEQKRVPLPGVWMPEGWPVSITSAEGCVIFAQKESDDRMSLTSFPVIAETRSKQAAITPCLQPSVLNLGEALLLLSEKEIALFAVEELDRVWSIPLGERQPLDFSCEGSQIAVLVRDEGGKTEVIVLGKNSGAELWSVNPEEIGMTRICGLVVHEGRLLLWGEGNAEQGILRLID